MRRAWNEGDEEEQLAVALDFIDNSDELPDLTEHERRYEWVSEFVDSHGVA